MVSPSNANAVLDRMENLGEYARNAVLYGTEDIDYAYCTGVNLAVAATFEDIWNGGGDYTPNSGAAELLSISSSEDTDKGKNVTVTGLDADGYYQTVTQALDATDAETEEPIPTLTWTAINRMTFDDSADPDGTVWLYKTGSAITNGVPDSMANARSSAGPGLNRTTNCFYAIPADKTGLLVYAKFGTSGAAVLGNEASLGYIYVKESGSNWRSIQSALAIVGHGNPEMPLPGGIKLPASSQVKLRASGGASNSIIAGNMFLLLFPNVD